MQTPDMPGAPSTGPRALLTFPTSPINSDPPPIPPPKPKAPLPSKLSIGVVNVRTPEQEIEFQECEAIVAQGWAEFARVGAALIRIRDKELYKNEHEGFEQYCRERWGFGGSKLWRYMAAADVHEKLALLPGVPLPGCEAQARPLTGLSAELAQQAWLQALGWTRDGHVSARLVKRAVRQLVTTEKPEVIAASNAERKQRCRMRQAVRTGFQELLALIMGNAARDTLLAKVMEIQGHLDRFLNPKKRVCDISPSK